jgi:hypothetical protein
MAAMVPERTSFRVLTNYLAAYHIFIIVQVEVYLDTNSVLL